MSPKLATSIVGDWSWVKSFVIITPTYDNQALVILMLSTNYLEKFKLLRVCTYVEKTNNWKAALTLYNMGRNYVWFVERNRLEQLSSYSKKLQWRGEFSLDNNDFALDGNGSELISLDKTARNVNANFKRKLNKTSWQKCKRKLKKTMESDIRMDSEVKHEKLKIKLVEVMMMSL